MKVTKRIKVILTAGILSLSIAATSIIFAQNFSANDPLISKSYIDQVLFPQITELINTRINDSGNGGVTGSANTSYEVITLQYGQKLVAKQGSIEIILRPGGSACIYSEIASNGLADLTNGNELLNSAGVPVNACLLVPRADGRGIVCTSSTAYVMVRGQYELKW